MEEAQNQLGRRLLNQQMQRRAVPKRPAGDRCGLSNTPTKSRDSRTACPKFRSPAKSSELLINLPANRGKRGKQRRVDVAFRNESDFASRRFFFFAPMLACLWAAAASMALDRDRDGGRTTTALKGYSIHRLEHKRRRSLIAGSRTASTYFTK